MMQVVETAIRDVKLLTPQVFGDDRGFFMETWNANTFAALGLDVVFVQDNHSRSAKHVLRGLHYQTVRPQGKLVRVVSGAAYDVAVDLRRSSTTFGKSVGVHLSAKNRQMFWIPPGFAHGYLSLSTQTDFVYKCTDFYAPGHEASLLWNDPVLRIDWPLDGVEPLLSAKDRGGYPLASAATFP